MAKEPNEYQTMFDILQEWSEKSKGLRQSVKDLLSDGIRYELHNHLEDRIAKQTQAVFDAIASKISRDQNDEFKMIEKEFVKLQNIIESSENDFNYYIIKITNLQKEFKKLFNEIDDKIKTLNYWNDNKLSPVEYENMFLAVKNNCFHAMKFWIRETPEHLNQQHYDRHTALNLALYKRNYQIAYYLVLNARADINGKSGHTLAGPLHVAVETGNLFMVKFLIDNGALVNLIDHNDETPLHYATKDGRADIARFLIENNASPNMLNKSHRRPVDLIPPYKRDKFPFM